MTDLPFLAAQASDEVGDRCTDFVGHIFLHVETRVDRHLGLILNVRAKSRLAPVRPWPPVTLLNSFGVPVSFS